jgi:putative hydrolase of the HAD superfamily
MPGPHADAKGVLLDVGGVLLPTPWELLEDFEAGNGWPPGTLPWRVPLDPATDRLWRAMQAGELSERAYWARRAAEVAAVSGTDGVTAMMARLYDGSEDELTRRQARALVAEARRRGLETAVLTNDLHAFHNRAWIDRIRFLEEVGCVVDTSHHGTRKPEPAAYRLVLDRIGVAADQAVFVDDQPVNTAGATAAGMAAVWFDVTRPDHSYQQVRQAIGLDGEIGGDP